MRHLYASSSDPGVSYLIDKAKTFERRRCDHRPEDYPVPLSSKECLASVVDPKGNGTNKHRYVVGSQELDVRKYMRGVKGVPLVYISRSVMIMEPMAEKTVGARKREERGKFREGIKRGSGALKRKNEDHHREEEDGRSVDEQIRKRRKVAKGPKGPNPLAVKKSKKRVDEEGFSSVSTLKECTTEKGDEVANGRQADGLEAATEQKRKRKRKHKSGNDGGGTTTISEIVDEIE